MKDPKNVTITDSEWMVMRAIWTMGHATSRELIDHMCAMRAGSTIAGVIQSRELSRADIANLQAILAEKAKTAPEEVQCNCLPGDQTC